MCITQGSGNDVFTNKITKNKQKENKQIIKVTPNSRFLKMSWITGKTYMSG